MQKTPSIPTSNATVAGETEPPNATTTTISSSSLLSLKNPLKTMQIRPYPSADGSKIFVHPGPIKVHPPPSPPATAAMVVAGETEPPNAATTTVGELVAENAVIVFGQRGCCMCHVVKLLLLGLGVNPTISAVEEGDVGGVIGELLKISAVDGGGGEVMELPVVYVGGKLFGGLERVMATHITGELVPLLKEANALWL